MSPLRQDPSFPHPSFVGRDRDVADLDDLIDSARMVTLTGSGGIGKTALAVHTAERVRGRFADGAVFVDLGAAVTGHQALRLVAAHLGVQARPGEPLDEAVPRVLRPREVLLVLDTCERAVAPLARLCRVLLSRCPRLRLLATSREPLRIPGETIWRVPPLSLPAAEPPYCPRGDVWRAARPAPGAALDEAMRHGAVRLFAARARRARPGFEVTAHNVGPIVRICQILDGVPLAVELAAARVQVLSPEQVLERLDDWFALLSSTDQSLPERHRTMRAAVEWSHALLTGPEKALLRRLSIFGNWSLDMAEDMFAADFAGGDALLELHGSLLDKSLIVVEAELEGIAYYRMLNSIRAYAAERLRASGEARTYCRRALEYGVRWVAAFSAQMAEPVSWGEQLLNRVDSNRDNIHSFLHQANEHGQVSEGLRICVGLRMYWLRRGQYSEGAGFLRSLLAAAPADLSPALRARALALYGELTLGLDETEAAEELVRDGLRLAVRAGDEAAHAAALGAAAQVSLRRFRLREGTARAAECLAAARRLGDRALECEALLTLGALGLASEELERSERDFSAALRLAEEAGDVWSAARCHRGLGFLAVRRDEPVLAEELLTSALTLFRERHAHVEAARCLAGLGRAATVRGHPDRAWEYLSEGVRQSIASGRRPVIACALEDLARLAALEELTDQMVLLSAQAEALREEAGQPSQSGAALRACAEARLGAAASATWYRARALSLEEALAAALPLPDGVRPSLTRREHQIAELAGAGLSNRDIAERLVISQATVARHIANIFAKLQISARGDLPSRLDLKRQLNSSAPYKTGPVPLRSE